MSRHLVPRTYAADDFDPAVVVPMARQHSVAVIIPARNESATIGAVIDAVQSYAELITELVVVDDHSSDDTATVAARHGARVIKSEGPVGKGEALQAGVDVTTSELLVFLDGDVLNTGSEYVPRLIQPLVQEPTVQLVKGFYDRTLHDMPSGGGRVTELAARPVLSLFYPGLGEIRQPLAGETALRRSALEQVRLASAYAVEVALLVDVAQTFGVGAIAQVDLGIRRHRNRPLEELRPMAVEVLRAVLGRSGVTLPEPT